MQSSKLNLEKLVSNNCLLFGNPSKITSKKIAQYLLGTRETMEVFKLYELRYLLLKIYPLIHNLFYNSRVNPQLKESKIWKKSSPSTVLTRGQQFFQKSFSQPWYKSKNQSSFQKTLPLGKNQTLPEKKYLPFRSRFFYKTEQKNIPPQILFASITPNFSKIISQAARICNMPWHQNRWLSGSITAAISYPWDKLVWQYLQDKTQADIFGHAFQKWGHNKEDKERIKEKIKHYGHSRWPSLLVIPDISNNIMILKEASKVGIPVIGLVNSNCLLEIDYPIFAQDETLQSIHFFCHFLAALIAKETVFLQHKRYTLQKSVRPISYLKTKKQKDIQKATKTKLGKKNKKKIKFTLKRGFHLQEMTSRDWRKPFFFKIFKSWKKKMVKRRFEWRKDHPIILQKIWQKETKQWFSSKQFSKRTRHRKRNKKTSIFLFKKWQTQRKKTRKKKRKNQALGFRNLSKTSKLFLKQLKPKRVFKMAPRLFSKLFFWKKLIRFTKIKGLNPLFKKKWRAIFKRKPLPHWQKYLKKQLFRFRTKKLFQKEYQRKYFARNQLTKMEKNKIYRKLRNFSWFSLKIKPQLKYFALSINKTLRYENTPHYHQRSLRQLVGDFKWREHRFLIKKTLLLKRYRELDGTKYWQYYPGQDQEPYQKTFPRHWNQSSRQQRSWNKFYPQKPWQKNQAAQKRHWNKPKAYQPHWNKTHAQKPYGEKFQTQKTFWNKNKKKKKMLDAWQVWLTKNISAKMEQKTNAKSNLNFKI